MDQRLDDRFEAFEAKYVDRYDEMITKLDKAIGQLQDARNTQEIHSQTHKDLNDDLEDHEERIASLEASSLTNA